MNSSSDVITGALATLLWALVGGTVVGAILGTLASTLPNWHRSRKDIIIAGVVGGVGGTLIAWLILRSPGGLLGILLEILVFPMLGSAAWVYRLHRVSAGAPQEAGDALAQPTERASPDGRMARTQRIEPAAVHAAVAVGQPVQAAKPHQPEFEKQRAETERGRGDIFLSYASSDRELARALASALQKQGWSVWWDRTIPPGKSFDEVIVGALDAAKCVIVLWSNDSVQSDWVKNEAREGLRRHILIPAVIAEVTIPFEFRHIQAADLVGWTSPDHFGFRSMVDSIHDMTRTAGPQKAASSS